MIDKIAILSDLHLNRWIRNAASVTRESLINQCKDADSKFSDVTSWVFAGDMGDGLHFNDINTQSQHLCIDGNNIYTTPGNHDHYSTSNRTLTSDLDYVFDSKSSLLATPLWTAFSLPGAQYNKWTAEQIYSVITDSKAIVGTSVDLIRQLNKDTINLIKLLQPRIIVTHFPPSMKSIGSRFANDPTNTYFVNDLDWLIEDLQPELWVCGHVHHKHSYYIGNTLVVCNPLGYPGEIYSKITQYTPMIVERNCVGKWRVVE